MAVCQLLEGGFKMRSLLLLTFLKRLNQFAWYMVNKINNITFFIFSISLKITRTNRGFLKTWALKDSDFIFWPPCALYALCIHRLRMTRAWNGLRMCQWSCGWQQIHAGCEICSSLLAAMDGWIEVNGWSPDRIGPQKSAVTAGFERPEGCRRLHTGHCSAVWTASDIQSAAAPLAVASAAAAAAAAASARCRRQWRTATPNYEVRLLRI